MILDRESFSNDPDVLSFVKFIDNILFSIPVRLKIKKSAKVPGGIDASVSGFQEVLNCYKWNSACLDASGYQLTAVKWAETRSLLQRLQEDLMEAIRVKNDGLAKSACLNILKWGGDRNSNVGATQDIKYLYGRNELCKYLQRSQLIISKNTITSQDMHSIPYTGSMWTKIYSLNSSDGLPIYDSRVAMAVIGLLLLFCQASGVDAFNNKHLTFRVPVGTNWERNKSAGIDLSKVSKISKNDPFWSVDTLKLSWLADMLLSQSNIFLNEGSLNARKHAFEATLFMIGYDLKSIIHDQ